MNRTRDDVALLILRLAGLMIFSYHGFGKLMALSSGEMRFVEGVEKLGLPLPYVMAWAATLAESAGGLLIAFGIWTRVAAAFGGITMAVAAFGRHHAHQQILAAVGLMEVPKETLEAWGKPELALLYLVVFLALLITGPGRFAIEGMGGRGRRS